MKGCSFFRSLDFLVKLINSLLSGMPIIKCFISECERHMNKPTSLNLRFLPFALCLYTRVTPQMPNKYLVLFTNKRKASLRVRASSFFHENLTICACKKHQELWMASIFFGVFPEVIYLSHNSMTIPDVLCGI
jgi:hypothetical protein